MKLYKCSYVIVKYIPDLIKDEPVNIGMIMHCSEEKNLISSFSDEKVNFINKYNSSINRKIVEALIEDLQLKFDTQNWLIRDYPISDFSNANLLEKLSVSHANQLRFTPPRGLITDDIKGEFDRLFEQYVYLNNKTQRKYISRQQMRGDLRREFTQRNLIEKKVVDVNFPIIGKFNEEIILDFKYLNGKVNLLQNISLPVDDSKVIKEAKAWYTNFSEIKSVDKDYQVTVIYNSPPGILNNDLKIAIDCLSESSDVLIDFSDKEKVASLIKKVEREAHN